MVVTIADCAPAPVPWMGTKTKEDSLGTLIWWGLTTGRGGKASPASSEEGLVPVPDLLSHLHFGKQKAWRGGASLISKASLIGW